VQTSDEDEVLSKVVSLVKSFPMVFDTPPERKEIKAIPDF
jgi:hypothetical protein